MRWQASTQKFKLSRRKIVFLVRTPEQQSTLPKETMQFPFLDTFKNPPGQSPEQPSLPPRLMLLWAGGWTEDLLRSLPAWIILWCLPVYKPTVVTRVIFPILSHTMALYWTEFFNAELFKYQSLYMSAETQFCKIHCSDTWKYKAQ